MKEIISSINKKIDLINSNMQLISEYINLDYGTDECNSDVIESVNNTVNVLMDYHNNYNQMYSLLQSFHYTVSNYDTVFFEEIEQKWLKILIEWFKIDSKIIKPDWNIDALDYDELGIEENCLENMQFATRSIENILIADTKGLNRFSLNYLNNKQKNIISFSDYKYLYSIKKEHYQKNKHIEELELFGEEALSTNDKRKMRINEFKIDEYIYYLQKRSEIFNTYKSYKSYMSNFMEENKDSILKKPFSFKFVKSIDYINSRISQKDYYIEQVFTYIAEHKQDFGITINKSDFEYIIVNKKLPVEMKKISWKGSPTNAFVFCKLFEIEFSRFNRCFNLSNGKLLKSNSAGKNPQTDFTKFTRNIAIEFDSAI